MRPSDVEPGETHLRAIRPVFDHLATLTDDRGLFEHALHATPRAASSTQ